MPEDKPKEDTIARAGEIFLILLLIVSFFNFLAPKITNIFEISPDGNYPKLSLGDHSISLPPQNLSDEKSLLGAAISDRVNLSELFSKVKPSSFNDFRNRAIFQAMKGLYDDNIPVTLTNLTARLAQANELSNVGGVPYLEDLITYADNDASALGRFFGKAGNIFRTIMLWIALLSIAGIIFVLIRFSYLQKSVLKTYVNLAPMDSINRIDERWGKIVTLAESQNLSDRKVAVMEADIMLDEMVTHMGYAGETVGEKLQSVEKSDFTTLDEAWRAHKIRNKVAHEGSPISRREAKEAILLYEKVFKEFEYL
ncbi:hypothetical protein CL634_03645 [bacterium]|nr:hypothetical protein [bacterium]|tara:strand:+ start:3034 stop:3966 length:933 start_codon:yes stop_codon:yes gene_type:complete